MWNRNFSGNHVTFIHPIQAWSSHDAHCASDALRLQITLPLRHHTRQIYNVSPTLFLLLQSCFTWKYYGSVRGMFIKISSYVLAYSGTKNVMKSYFLIYVKEISTHLIYLLIICSWILFRIFISMIWNTFQYAMYCLKLIITVSCIFILLCKCKSRTVEIK